MSEDPFMDAREADVLDNLPPKEEPHVCEVATETASSPEVGRDSNGTFTVTQYCECGRILGHYQDSLL